MAASIISVSDQSFLCSRFPLSNSQRTLSPSTRNNLNLQSNRSVLSISVSSWPCPCSAGALEPEVPVDENPSSNPNPSPSSSAVTPAREGGKDRRRAVRIAWEKLVRWSRSWRSKAKTDVLERTKKVVVLGGGSFGTAMAAHIASKKADMEVSMLVRDVNVCCDINETHFNW